MQVIVHAPLWFGQLFLGVRLPALLWKEQRCSCLHDGADVTTFQWFGVTGDGGFAPLRSLWCFSFTRS